MECMLGLFVITIIAVLFLKEFDKVAGRGPTQVSDGIRQSDTDQGRIPCPLCAEKILPQAKICPFCKSTLKG
jgi:hypothetical protein